MDKNITYSISCDEINGLVKNPTIWINEGNKSFPLCYIRKPKWIRNDEEWKNIIKEIYLGIDIKTFSTKKLKYGPPPQKNF